jgi:hypothetical protein
MGRCASAPHWGAAGRASCLALLLAAVAAVAVQPAAATASASKERFGGAVMAPRAGFWHYAVLAEDDLTTEASQRCRCQAAMLSALHCPAPLQPTACPVTGSNSLKYVNVEPPADWHALLPPSPCRSLCGQRCQASRRPPQPTSSNAGPPPPCPPQARPATFPACCICNRPTLMPLKAPTAPQTACRLQLGTPSIACLHWRPAASQLQPPAPPRLPSPRVGGTT